MVRRDPIFRNFFYHRRNSAVLSSPFVLVSNELASNNRNQIGDEYLHFLVYREVEKVLRLCLFAPLAGYGTRFETPENREYKREIGRKCVSLRLRINRLKKKKKKTTSSV